MKFASVFLCVVFILGSSWLLAQEASTRQEESVDYFSKWLKEDVFYIITPEEKSVFEKLTTVEEKERFVEQFWYRRDPDPRTSENEFRAEHYRRIAYANERFTSGYPGWMTDRGQVYIIHGPPDEIESHASAGAYERPMNEGGGNTTTFPFEVWRYRHVEGVGDNIELEFVDRSLSGEYRMALSPEDKDALLYVPGAGLTLAEEMGISTKANRPFFNPLRRQLTMAENTARDDPFYRYGTYTAINRPKEIKFTDLQKLVGVNVEFDNLPFKLRTDFFHLGPSQVLVTITVQVENKDLTFEAQATADRSTASVAVYGVLTSLGNRLAAEFDHELVSQFAADQVESGRLGKSVYQKTLLLDSGRRYKLGVVVKDLNSDQVGLVQRALMVPSCGEGELCSSSVVLANSIQVLETEPELGEMFTIGDVKVMPNLDRTFSPGRMLGLYFQVYNAGLDQSNHSPSLTITFELIKNGKAIRQLVDRDGRSLQYASEQRVVVVQALGLEGLSPDRYTIRILVEDNTNRNNLELNVPFTLSAM